MYMSSFLLIAAIVFTTTPVISLDTCNIGYFTNDAVYPDVNCVLKCYESGSGYVSYDVTSLSFDLLKSYCPAIQSAIDQYGSATCSTFNDLVFPDTCSCPACPCTETDGAINIIEELSGFTKTCTTCQCNAMNSNNEKGWDCNRLYAVSNPREWNDFTCSDPPVQCADPYSTYSTRYPGNGWFVSSTYDPGCQTYCYCNFDGSTDCETSFYNILNSVHPELTTQFFYDCDYYVEGCQNSPELLYNDSSYCGCPGCKCAEGITADDTEWVEYTDLVYDGISNRDDEDTTCMECTCYDDGSGVLQRECDVYGYNSYSYAAGTGSCPAVLTGGEGTCLGGESSTQYTSAANQGQGLQPQTCYGDESGYCGWTYQTGSGYTFYDWGCQSATMCEVIVQDHPCVTITIPPGLSLGSSCEGEGISEVFADGMEVNFFCCQGSSCNEQNINTALCVEDLAISQWYEDYFKCLYGDLYDAFLCVDTEMVTCTYLQNFGTWYFGCDCTAWSYHYATSSTESQQFFEGEIASAFGELDEWSAVIGCDLVFTCDLTTGEMSVNGVVQGPVQIPTRNPSESPVRSPTEDTLSPTFSPTPVPTKATTKPTRHPSPSPTETTDAPSPAPTAPSNKPSVAPSPGPTAPTQSFFGGNSSANVNKLVYSMFVSIICVILY